MLSYEQIKTWLKEKENKNKVVLVACFIVVFLVGFGTGRYERGSRRDTYKPLSNYTTQSIKKPQGAPAAEADVAGVTTTTLPSLINCVVKGNISAKGKKVYHVVGGAFYKIVKPEQCFKTEAEAVTAGFVKSSR